MSPSVSARRASWEFCVTAKGQWLHADMDALPVAEATRLPYASKVSAAFRYVVVYGR